MMKNFIRISKPFAYASSFLVGSKIMVTSPKNIMKNGKAAPVIAAPKTPRSIKNFYLVVE